MEVAKPVFVGRAERERERLALAEQRRSAPLDVVVSRPAASTLNRQSSDNHMLRRRDRKRDRGLDGGIDGERDRLAKVEMELIREQYVGSKRPKRQITKRFSFDWDNADDTSIQRDEPCGLLFGRGFLAGIDRRQQKKEAEARRRSNNKAEDHHAHAASDSSSPCSKKKTEMHWSEKSLEEMTERDWRVVRDQFDISYKQHGGGGGGVPKPLRNWSESGLGPDLLRAVETAGYRDPSPIQRAAIPLGLAQRDVMGVAETGSGKTAAFVLPMLHHITARLPPITDATKDQGPYALVLAPTRELAQQIHAETVKLLPPERTVRVVAVVGGHQDIRHQATAIAGEGCEVVVATPGRMLDLLDSRFVVLNQCSYVVLDEADRMVDSTFERQVVRVLDAMPSFTSRTTFMFSATMPPAVERVARKYLRSPVVVTVGTAGKATDLVTQDVVMVRSEADKTTRLREILLAAGDTSSVIVFCNTRRAADVRARDLENAGFRVAALHGGMSQRQREDSLAGFRNRRRFNVLVATDLAARGIDVPDVAHVINYEMPGSIESYTHRIGRTGRAGNHGMATSFLTLQDTHIFFHLKQMLVQTNSHVPPELARHKASKFKPG